ncbi:MAG: T9SS type A sorting domain-containing protein [FCB group bacterium]|nr:T9SS type A sorting domain-containing protein [FCB group bacterium]MBL7028693.1 T9SS type A sorting domain-containing protein [Candidatus Neomarinimicrobiota bacterium]MBL7120703.1 T9SS type A sorting domain-containing protein [Candidatus Neomarinimicrobiota bacterium]
MKNRISTIMRTNVILILAIMLSNICAFGQDFDNVEVDWMQTYGSELISADNRSVDMVLDVNGNVYVLGISDLSSSYFPSTEKNYSVTKFTPNGDFIWEAQYNGPANEHDLASALTVDEVENVYITGRSYGLNGNYEIATVKYTSDGTEAWVARYNGLNNNGARAKTLRVDSAGNIYVMGLSNGISGGINEPIIIKYASDGNEMWVTSANNSEVELFDAREMVLDSAGNIIITGETISDSSSAFKTIRYTPDGIQMWAAIYSGNGIGWNSPIDMVVDNEGTVYVVGTSIESDSVGKAITIKYSSNGVETWVVEINEHGNDWVQPSALAVDANANVYVTGHAFENDSLISYSTVKYSSDGIEAWVAAYSTSENSWTQPTAMALDADANIYVTGITSDSLLKYSTIKYSPDGTEIWVAENSDPGNNWEGPVGLAVDAIGNVFVTSTAQDANGHSNSVTTKYSAEGNELLIIRYARKYSWDNISDLVLDTDGNIYVTGRSEGAEGNQDYATVKYFPDGNEAWTARYNGPGNGFDWPQALVVDLLGNVIVTGRSPGSSDDNDYATIKYSPDGNEVWVARYNGQGNDDDNATALTVDAQGNIFVTGYGYGLAGNEDYATIKYSPEGDEIWVAGYNGTGDDRDVAFSLTTDSEGYVYVTGYSKGLDSNSDYLTIKYTPDGTELWVARYNGPGNGWDIAKNVVVDGGGNVFITGGSVGLDGGYDYATVKYNSIGVETWLSRYNGPVSGFDIGWYLSLDSTGNLLVSGTSDASETDCDFVIIKYLPDGSEAWITRSEAGNNWDVASGMEIDPEGNIYVTGTSIISETDRDFVTIKYSPEGDEIWMTSFSETENSWDEADCIALDADGNVYVGGTSSYGESSFFKTIKYFQSTLTTSGSVGYVPESFQLHQNHPNPFNPTTTIIYSLPEQSSTKLTVFDIKGQEVTVLSESEKPPGFYEVQWNGMDQSGNQVSTGVYFCRLEAGEFSQTIKMVYLR